MSTVRIRLCRLWFLALSPVILPASGGAGAPDGSLPDGPVCEMPAEEDDLRPPETRLQDSYGDKAEKACARWMAPSRRPGVQPLLTTLYNIHSREALPVFDGATPDPQLLRYFFRCRGFNVQTDLDPRLLAAVLAAAKHFAARRTTIISGFRSPKFNDLLAKKGRRVASESRHMKGEAVDFRLDTIDAVTLGKWLRETHDGGVGIYPQDDFVHIDVGMKRAWFGQ